MPDTDLPTDGSMNPIADAAMPPMDDAAGPTDDKQQIDEPSDEEAAAQLGDFA